MLNQIRQGVTTLVVFTIITGGLYPLFATALAQTFFPTRANGSLIVKEGKTVGSELVGQPFTSDKYFWPRLSATAPHPYNAAASSGSNQGPLHADLEKKIKDRIGDFNKADPDNKRAIPVDLVTASGSGLDPHISPAAALYQASRVAKARNLEESAIIEMINEHTDSRQFGFLGEPRVNVLKLNLALDTMNNAK